MDVILLEHIESLGQIGDVVTVKPGYARNFLIPQKKALTANPANLDWLNRERAKIEARQAALKADAETRAQSINQVTVTVEREAGDEGKLFGSITLSDLVELLQEKGISVEKRQIALAQPIRQVGEFSIEVKLFPGVRGTFKLIVAKRATE